MKKRTYLAALAAAIALGTIGGSGLAAQQPAKPGTPQHDSLKAVKKSLRSDKAARAAAKARGDTAAAKALKKQIKAEKKQKAALKAESTKTTTKKPAKP